MNPNLDGAMAGDDTVERQAPAERRDTGRRLRGAVARRIGVAILSGEFAPGELLSTEQQFADELAVSRTAYREALQQLVAKGLVESRPKIGTRVLPRERWNLLDTDVLAWAFAGEPDPDIVRGLFEMRSVVEPAAAAYAAERRTREHVKAMRNALARMARHSLATEQGRAADRDFHGTVLHATGNPVMIALSSSIGAAVNWTTEFKQRSRALPRDPVPAHRRVLDAIVAGDPDQARAAMHALVDQGLEDTQGIAED